MVGTCTSVTGVSDPRHTRTSSCLFTTEQLLFDADNVLFHKVLIDGHCLYHLLPLVKTLSIQLRPASHNCQLPICKYMLHKRSFLYVVFLLSLICIHSWCFLFFSICVFFYIRDVSIVCLYVHHVELSCGIKSILTYLFPVSR